MFVCVCVFVMDNVVVVVFGFGLWRKVSALVDSLRDNFKQEDNDIRLLLTSFCLCGAADACVN